MNDEKNKKYYLNNTSYIEYSMTTMDSKQHKELSLSFIQKYIQRGNVSFLMIFIRSVFLN